MGVLFKRMVLLLAAPACLAAGSVHAACSNPAGNEADEIYNSSYHTYQFCNGTNWVSESGSGGGGSLTLISTQIASSSASLQFTGLPTIYNTLFLNCNGLLASSGTANFLLLVGEGATPTWETGSHYTIAGYYGGHTNANLTLTTATNLLNLSQSSTTIPQSLKVYIDNIGSSALYKNVTSFQGVYSTTGGGYYMVTTAAYWNNDTNPVTGIELSASTGTIASGQCSLYGVNN
jgi:hypothetical protein